MANFLNFLYRPLAKPRRPQSPTHEYRPGPKADPKVIARLREICAKPVEPGFPRLPKGTLEMDGMQSAMYHVMRHNRQVAINREKAAWPVGPHLSPWVEWGHTARVEQRPDGWYLVLNQAEPVQGTRHALDFPSGSFPADTRQVVHVHPPDSPGKAEDLGSKCPSPEDYKYSYESVTNALHREGTDIPQEMMIDSTDMSAYLYSGNLDADGQPQFYRGIPVAVPGIGPITEFDAPTHRMGPLEYLTEIRIPATPAHYGVLPQ